MNTKRVGILAGTILSGALLLGTAGLVFAQGPTTSPSPSATSGMSGGMMSDQGQMRGQIQGQMRGQIQRMMSRQGQMSSQGQGMMSGLGQGAMGGGMGTGQMPDMTAMHAAMGQDGTWDLKLMQSMHRQAQSTR